MYALIVSTNICILQILSLKLQTGFVFPALLLGDTSEHFEIKSIMSNWPTFNNCKTLCFH